MSDINVKELNRKLEELFVNPLHTEIEIENLESEPFSLEVERTAPSNIARRKLGAIHPFSPFDNQQLEVAGDFARKYEHILAVAIDHENGLAQIVAAFAQDTASKDVLAAQYGMRLFLVHHPDVHGLELPALEKQYPDFIKLNVENQTRLEMRGAEGAISFEAAVSTGEPDIKQFREDILLNEHHIHWHVVYDRRKIVDRGGEMFLYMHRQMLARYDAERLSVNLLRVEAFNQYEGPVDPYDPGLPSSGNRKLALEDITKLENGRTGIKGKFELYLNNPKKAVDLLGNDTEWRASNEPENLNDSQRENNFHGSGHGAVVNLSVATSTVEDELMGDPATACRHAFFWRWHKEVDNLYDEFLRRMPVNAFGGGPEVRINKIILCREDGLPTVGDLQQIGKEAFSDWEAAFQDGPFEGGGAIITTTDELQTVYKMYEQIKYLTHKGLAYFLRVENLSSRDIESTVRIFIAPEQTQEDYRSWIEMDKFIARLSPGKNVIYQNAKESSVIQKPAVLEPNPERTQGDSGCQCGWPYTLLLPRGNEEGMPYVMLVMLTDWNEDKVSESTCGSISFCGVTNQNQPYPDSRALGYPFDRPMTGIANTLMTNPHMATRTFKIRHLGLEG